MSATRMISLQQVHIPNPCPKRWDEMTGGDAVRFCGHCQKHVYNLSALTADAAQRLICEKAGSLCAAYVPTETLRAVTTPPPE